MLQMWSGRAYLSGLHSGRNEWSDPYRWRCRSSAASAYHGRRLIIQNARPTIEFLFCIMYDHTLIHKFPQTIPRPFLAPNVNEIPKSEIPFNGVLHPSTPKDVTNGVIHVF